MAVYDDVKRALQDILAPQLAEIRGELATLRADMDRGFVEVRSEIAQLRAEMRQEINNLHTDLVRVEQVFNARLQGFELVERVVRLEERVTASKQAPAG